MIKFDLMKVMACKAVLILVVLFLPCQYVSAQDLSEYLDDTYIDTYDNYTARLSGANTIAIQLPVYDGWGWHSDRWVDYAWLEYIVLGDGGESVKSGQLLNWWSVDTDISSSANTLTAHIYASNYGEFDITPGTGTLFHLPNATGSSRDFTVTKHSNVTYFVIYADWVVPQELQGKKVKFNWHVHVKGNLGIDFNFTTMSNEIEIPAGSVPFDPTLSEPILSPEDKGELIVPWFITAQTVVSANAHYLDNDSVDHSIPLEAATNGFVHLKATEPHRQTYVEVSYKDYYGYLKANRQSSPRVDIPMIHAPKNFRSTHLDDGKGSVLLEWDISDNDYPDYFETDFFEIQRSLTGSDDDYESLTVVPLDLDNPHYSFKDTTYVSSLGNNLVAPKYRIRRMITDMWGWDAKDNPTVQSATTDIHPMQLFVPTNAKADWESESEHKVKVAWDYSNADNMYAIWDDRAEVKICVKAYNRDGNLLDVIETTLTSEEIKKKEKVVQLSRSCVNYAIELVYDSKTSPVSFGTNNAISKKIYSVQDWRALKESIEGSLEGQSMNVELMADITIGANDALGNREKGKYFTGTFDGHGHTITRSDMPPFFIVQDAVIRNLRVDGAVDCSQNGGNVGLVLGGNNLTVENCRVDVDFQNVGTGIAFLGLGTKVTFRNCLFGGKVSQTSFPSQWGGFTFVAFADAISNTYNVENCVSAPHPDSKILDGTSQDVGCGANFIYSFFFGTQPAAINVTNSYYKGIHWTQQPEYNGSELPPTTEEQLAALGSQWQACSEWPGITPVMSGASETKENILAVAGPADNPKFYFQSSGKVEKTLRTETRQSSVVLVWETDGGPIDYFVVQRREKGSDKDFETIADNLDNTTYEDRTVSPLLTYEYKVLSAVDCEGTSYEETDVAEGACKHTGMVEGYLRFPDGTGMPGVDVAITLDGRLVQTVTTDEHGHFVAEELSYNNSDVVTYKVAPVGTNNLKLKVSSYEVTFKGDSNYQSLPAFVVTSGVRFSGYVMYAGTSIPVKGARFMLNNHEVHNVNGKPVESDFDGKVSFYVNSSSNVIQAVMDGHKFTNGGYFKSADGYTFTGDVDQAFFYDETTVKLVGRIVGGDAQGDLPLDNNLSRNNLGTGVKMVLTLEGDNSSWLVYDNLQPEKSTRDEVIAHTKNDSNNYKTKVHTTRKRMEVSPDSLTGEYTLYLPPVRWKVQQVYANGYPTLFQDGMVSEVIDLTNCLEKHTDVISGLYKTCDGTTVDSLVETYYAKYNRIYHAPVELIRKQVVYDDFDYFGDKTYVSRTANGTKTTVPLAYPDAKADGGVAYTFGHPVFSLDRIYPLKLSAVERYYWNNNPSNDTVDVVKVGGGKVTIHNGLESGTHKEVVQLDDNGEAYYGIKVKQINYLLQGDDALRNITLTLEQDGTTFEAERIQGYVFNIFSVPGTKDILNVSAPILVDILRDPPGGGSTATLHKGSTLRSSYSVDMTMAMKAEITLSYGTTLDNYTGVVVAPEGMGYNYGLMNESNNNKVIDTQYGMDAEGNKTFSYTMNVEEDITTSGDNTMTGAEADLYIGMVNNMVVMPAYTIRAVPDSIYSKMTGMLAGGVLPTGGTAAYGSMVEIAKGTDADGGVYHLISDQSLSYGPQVESRFIHSQKYILEQLIPSLVEQCRALMFIGTAEEAQTRANDTGMAVYRSLREPTDSLFGGPNMKDGQLFYNINTLGMTDSMSYVIYLPQNIDKLFHDKVSEHWQAIIAWINMISTNEMEKLLVGNNDLLKNYDIDGGSSVSYSESFSSDFSTSNYLQIPGFHSAAYFEDETAGYTITGLSFIAVPLLRSLINQMWGTLDTSAYESGKADGDNRNSSVDFSVKFNGSSIAFRLLPTFAYTTKGVGTEGKAYERRESFNISFNGKSHLDFDVYRVKSHLDALKSVSPNDVYTSQNLDSLIAYSEGYISREYDISNWTYPRGFVYRTRGGATARPWQRGYKSLFYWPGTIIDERTKQIENPKIQLDKQSISGVASGEPARFKVYLTNESEEPEAATGGLAFYNFYVDETTNPHGAKLYVDGTPFTGAGRSIRLTPGEVTQKTLEVYAGEDFDYEGIVLGVMSQEDFTIGDEVSFDVHYLRQAGKVEISTPSDKWIMNTEAQFDDERGYFLPVVISGFDKHQKNFDHIEFQYKETSRGDDNWTSLCSYYADSTLMAKANGVTEMIPENGNITTKFYGEGVVMEKAYDLRAVLYCRNGNSFLTTSSRVLSGIKDTRRPQLFGAPEPIDGILDAGENIVFNFSEDIEYNYLRETTHFEVRGEVNNDNVTEDVSLLFTDKSSVETEARRNFNGKNVTLEMLVKPDDTGEDMPLFSHGTNGKKLQLWITADKHLKAVVNNQEIVSDSVLNTKNFTQVAMVIKQPAEGAKYCLLQLYNGGSLCAEDSLMVPYTGVSPLYFGRTNEANRNNSKYYRGRMMEARLWYRALDGEQIGTEYGWKRLSGYELGLVAYYPMNEGNGQYALDKSQGANATLHNTTWAMPHGMSLHLDFDDRGLALNPNAITRTAEQDYTLMFWFKTNSEGRGILISNGAGLKSNIGARNQYCIGFEAEKLMYRSNGMAVEVPGNYSDNSWHHFAMTVNRPMNVANIYVDSSLRATFTTDSLGGISGGYPMLGGAKYDEKRDGKTSTFDARNWLRGNLDEICFFEQALPLTLINSYSSRSPRGDEAGLLTYITFDNRERQSDNTFMTVPYVYSKKMYKDSEGNIIYEKDSLTQMPTSIPQRDYLFADSIDVVLSHIDQSLGAPVLPNNEMHNLNFNFVGRDHSLLVNIKNANEKINKRNVYVTVREIPDLNGNTMLSPATACFLVNYSPLRWQDNNMRETAYAGYPSDISLGIENNSAEKHTYTIENYPKWLTFDHYTNVISANSSAEITATVSKNLNVGTYDEIIYLTDENGLTEPLFLTVVVEGKEPYWTVSGDMLHYTMNIIGEVSINDEIDIDTHDIVGVFDNTGECHGVAHIDYSELTGESRVYLTVYDKEDKKKQLYFKLWNYATGLEMMLTPSTPIVFERSAIIGSDEPVNFKAGRDYVQNINLKSGWNWVSFNVSNENLFNLNALLDNLPWKENDVLTDMNSDVTLIFNDGHWRMSGNVTNLGLSVKSAYAVNVQDDIVFPVSGAIIEQEDTRTIQVHQGWNGIGYTPMMNLSVETALADYYDKASDGDVIKSHTEFAVFQSANGVGRWKGDLKYMKPGEGYMLFRKKSGKASFIYPFFEPGSRFLDETANAPVRQPSANQLHNMSLSAVAAGIELEPGDRLLAYADGELRGAAHATDSVFYVSVGGDKRQPLSFAIEREGEIIATTSEVLMYETNAVVGTPDQPTRIDFTRRDIPNYGWYTLDGIRLNKRPVKKGVYIFNGKKRVVE